MKKMSVQHVPVSEKNRKAQTMRSIVDAMLGLSQRQGS